MNGTKPSQDYDISSPIDLVDSIDYSANSVVSQTLKENKAGTITLFAFDAGQGLSEHSAPFDAVVQIVDGEAELVIGGNELHVTSGQMVIMPANVPHAVRARHKFKMLLTMLKA
jgi:quercetin dioxygenase-like cupin family protein